MPTTAEAIRAAVGQRFAQVARSPDKEQGRGILGVVDGFSPKGVEDEGEIKWRKDFLRKIGYKL